MLVLSQHAILNYQLNIPVLSVSYSWLLCTRWNEEDLALLVPEEVSSIESVDS